MPLPIIIRLYSGLLYAPAMGWVGSVSRPTYYSPAYGGTVSNTDPIHKGMNQIHTPTQKSVSIAAYVDGVNLADCTNLCNRLKIALVPMPSKLSVF